jgi:hypothetical protein
MPNAERTHICIHEFLGEIFSLLCCDLGEKSPSYASSWIRFLLVLIRKPVDVVIIFLRWYGKACFGQLTLINGKSAFGGCCKQWSKLV